MINTPPHFIGPLPPTATRGVILISKIYIANFPFYIESIFGPKTVPKYANVNVFQKDAKICFPFEVNGETKDGRDYNTRVILIEKS